MSGDCRPLLSPLGGSVSPWPRGGDAARTLSRSKTVDRVPIRNAIVAVLEGGGRRSAGAMTPTASASRRRSRPPLRRPSSIGSRSCARISNSAWRTAPIPSSKRSTTGWPRGLTDGHPQQSAATGHCFTRPATPDELRPEFVAIGKRKLRELNASQVRQTLSAAAQTRSAATVSLIHNCVVRAIRQAEGRDLVRRNVAALIDTPEAKGIGRPSRSLTLEQAVAVITAAKSLPEIELRPD
jgi:hypothetical protein